MTAFSMLALLLTHPIEFRTLVQFWLFHEQKRDISAQQEHSTSGWDRKSMRRCWDFLDQTSRSFSAVIKELDGDLARTVNAIVFECNSSPKCHFTSLSRSACFTSSSVVLTQSKMTCQSLRISNNPFCVTSMNTRSLRVGHSKRMDRMRKTANSSLNTTQSSKRLTDLLQSTGHMFLLWFQFTYVYSQIQVCHP
jgi:hypothetical protein